MTQRQSLEADAVMMQAQQEEQQQQEDTKQQLDDTKQQLDAMDELDDGGKRRLFRFKPAFDVVLVREVIRCFPWAAGYGRTRSAWMSVASRVQTALESMKGVVFTRGSALDHAIVKRRVDMLLDAFRKSEMSGLRGSGSPEEFDMRNKLLAILTRVVDEHTLNKGALREKRVQSALQVALQSLAELEGSAGIVMPPAAGLTPPPAAAATPPPPTVSLMPIAPAPTQTVPPVQPRVNPSPSPVQQQVQQNGGNKRPLRVQASPVAALQEAKRPRVDRSEATMSLEERKLCLEERRVALEEERLAWEKLKSEQDSEERQNLLDVLRTQGDLVTELFAHLRNTKPSMNQHDL